MSPAAGVILFDKPAGITSHDAVAATRRRLGRGTRVGHSGTLDPFATGLLLILVGRATRLQRLFMALPKTYEATARFGAVSTTLDPDGEITETGMIPSGDLVLPTGRLRQRPPAYSAVKIGGRRAYALARAGEAVETAEREVTVHRFEELWREGARRGYRIECSSGTYVRSLLAELGDAYCEALRRIRVGSFDVLDADPERVLTLDRALAHLPEIPIPGDTAERLLHGAKIDLPLPDATDDSPAFRVVDTRGLVALAERGSDGALRATLRLRDPAE